MAESRHQRHDDDERDDGIYVPPPREQVPPPSPWAPPQQIQPHQAADNAVLPGHAAPPPGAAAPALPPAAVPPPGASPVAWQQDATWQPEQVLTGEVEQGPAVQETDIYGNPVPGHYRSGVRYADADAEIDNDHFSAGRTVWSQPSPQAWTPEEPHRPAPPPGSSETQALAPIPPSPPMRAGPPAAPTPAVPPPSSPARGMFEPARPAPSPPRGMFEPAGPAPSPPRGMFEPASPPRPGEIALPGGLALPAQRPPSELTGPPPTGESTGPGGLTGPPPPGGYAPVNQPQPPAGTSQPTSSGELIPRSAGFAASAPPIQPTAPPAPPMPPIAPPSTPPSGFDPASTSGQPPIQPTLSQQFSRRSGPAPARPYFPPPEALASAPASAPPKAAPPPLTRSGSGGRQGWWVALGAAVLALAIAAGALIGLNIASHSGDKSQGSLAAGTSCGGRPVLSVAVAPEFAPIVEKAAAAIPGAADGCSMVKVAALEPAATLSTLANNPPDAWIPPSTAWLRMSGPRTASAPGSGGPTAAPAPKPSASSSPNNGLFVPDATSLARSPIVVAAPKPFADGIGWPDKQLGWTQLTAGVISHQIPRFSMGNPLKDTASLLAVLGVQVAMAGTTKDPGIAQMRALTLRARLADADADPTDLLKKAAGLTDPAKAIQELGLFPVSEQELWQYNRESHQVQLAGIYPTDTLMEADYPLALTTKTADDQARRDIATKLADLITARTFIGSLTERGFRPAAKTASAAGAGIALAPNASGLLAQYPRPIPLPPQVAEPAAIWAQYKQLTFQTLLLVDGSGSMNDPVRLRDGTQSTKADLLRQAGAQASQLFGEETSLGMWLFASPNAAAPPFLVALPFGPINEKINGVPRRDVMRTVAAGYKAYPSAGTPLFETVLRGIDDMRKRQKANTITMVVVLTDGRDEDSPFSMTQQQFLAKLNALRDPARPLPVFAIGYGADADMDVLNQMAKLTGGQAAASNDPSDLASAMAKIFLAAHLR